MSKEIVSEGEDYVVVQAPRGFASAQKNMFQVRGEDGRIRVGNEDGSGVAPMEIGSDGVPVMNSPKFIGTPVMGGKAKAASATALKIADPGASGAISVVTDGVCMLTSAGAETRTLAIPTYIGQRMNIAMDTDGGDIVVTVAQVYDQSAHTTITFNDAGDMVELIGITVGGALRWRLVTNLGTTLG